MPIDLGNYSIIVTLPSFLVNLYSFFVAYQSLSEVQTPPFPVPHGNGVHVGLVRFFHAAVLCNMGSHPATYYKFDNSNCYNYNYFLVLIHYHGSPWIP